MTHNLLFYLMETSAYFILCYAIYWLFLKRETAFHWNRFFLLFGSLFCLVVPFIEWPLTKTTVLHEMVITIGAAVPISPEMVSPTLEESTWSMYTIFLWIYLIGCVLVFAKILLDLIRIARLLMVGDRKDKGDYRLVLVQDKIPVFSFFNYVFYSKQATYTNEEKEQILWHERAHVQEFHSLDILLMSVISIFFWFNPVIYLIRKKMRQTHEFIADSFAVEQGKSKVAYAGLLVQTAQHAQLNLDVVHTFNYALTKKRLLMINTIKKPLHPLRAFASVCLPMILFLFFISNGLLMAQELETINPDEVKKGQIYLAYDSDNEFTVRPDGTRYTKEEAIENVIRINSKDGKKVTKDQVHLVSKADLFRNVRSANTSNPSALPAKKADYRLILVNTKDNSYQEMFPTFILMDNNRKKVKVMKASIRIQKMVDAKTKSYETRTYALKGNLIDEATLKEIKSLKSSGDSFHFFDVTFMKDNKEFIIKEEFSFTID